MLGVCFVCEDTYQGLHGINDYFTFDTDDESIEDIKEAAINCGLELISSYSHIFDYEYDEYDEYDDEDIDLMQRDSILYYSFVLKDGEQMTQEELEDALLAHGFYYMELDEFEQKFKSYW